MNEKKASLGRYKEKRKNLCFNLRLDDYERFKAYSARTGRSLQSIFIETLNGLIYKEQHGSEKSEKSLERLNSIISDLVEYAANIEKK